MTAVDLTLKVLYVRGATTAVDDATAAQLREVAPELDITTVKGSADALAEIRRSASGWHAILVSPTLPQNETLALIASLRRDRVAIAIVPVVDEAHQELFAAAVASGADDVLMRRGQTLVNVAETLARIRQSPHLFPVEQRRRISVLYAGRDTLVWNLLDQVPFVKAEKVVCGIDGSCPVRAHGSNDGTLRTDAVVIDEQPGDAHPLQVLKSVKAQASDLPVIVLTSTGSSDIATAALELGADDTVLKTGIFRRRLIATLRRVHQRLDLTSQQAETKAREERLRQIVENVPTGITVIASDGAVLAMNGAALRLFAAGKPRDVVGRDFRLLVTPADHAAVTDLIRRVTKGEGVALDFQAQALDGTLLSLTIRGVVLERDAKGGRGVVASISRTGTDRNPVADGMQAAELGNLQESLQRLERHYAELEEARTNERTEWETERRRLEARLETAEKTVAERAELAERLDEVSAELARTSHTFAAERQTLEGRLQELEAAARDAAAAGSAQAELETTLTAVRDELRQAVAAHALERSGWQSIRQELEARVQDLDTARHAHAGQAESLASLEAQIQQLNEALASERANWAATRTHFETDLRNAREALWAEHNDRDAARAAFDAELTQVRELLSHERAAWAATRSGIDAALAAAQRELEDTHTAWATTEARLGAELAEARSALDVERQAWQEARGTLERELAGARAAATTEQEWTAERARLEAEIHDAAQILAREREAWSSEQQRLTAGIERAEEATRAVTDEYDATRSRLESERDQAQQLLDATRASWDLARAALETERDDARRLLADELGNWDTVRRTLEAELAQLRERADVVSREAEDLRGRAHQLDETRARLEAERDDARRQLEDERGAWNGLRVTLDSDLARLRETAEATSREAEDLRGRTHQLDETRAALEAERDDARRQLEEERGTWNGLRAALDGDLARLRETAEATSREAEDLRGRTHQLDETRAALEAERDEARRQLEDERGNWNGLRTTLEGDMAHLRETVETASREAEDLRGQTHRLDETRAALEADRDEARRRLHEEHEAWTSHKASLEAQLHEVRSRSGETDALRGELDAARARQRDLEAAHAAARAASDQTMRILDADGRRAAEEFAVARASWMDERRDLERRIDETSRVELDRKRLEESIDALRADYASMVQSLSTERQLRERDQRQIESLQAAIAESDRRRERLEREFEQTTVDAEALIRRREIEHTDRLRTLEHEVAQGASRMARLAEEADRARATLHIEYARAAESHNRLVASDLFGYAVTTPAGELVRCNDAFARMFGFANGPDAMTRTAGRLFPGLAGRTSLAARLASDGHVDRVESCLARIDGQPIRVIESATLLVDQTDEADEETLVEHVLLATSAGPNPEELQARRLEEVGALASAMVPDIEGLVTTLHERANDHGHDRHEIVALAAQVAALVRQLGAFSRRQIRVAEPVEISAAVLRAEPMLVRLVGDYIGFTTDLKATSPITAQADDLDQLLTSLVTLARDLLPAGGSIVVETRQHIGADTDDSGELDGPALVISASGYGVQFPERPSAVELVAERCGGHLTIAGEPGWLVRLGVTFPRCGGPAKSGWNWLSDRD